MAVFATADQIMILCEKFSIIFVILSLQGSHPEVCDVPLP